MLMRAMEGQTGKKWTICMSITNKATKITFRALLMQYEINNEIRMGSLFHQTETQRVKLSSSSSL